MNRHLAMAKNTESNTDDFQGNSQEEQDVNQMVETAVNAAAKGASVEQLMEVMLASVSTEMRDKVRKRFTAALAKRGLRAPKKDADLASRNALSRVRQLLAVTAKQAMERVRNLMRARPDIAASVQQAGQVLMKNGVSVDRIQISEAELGTLAPRSVGQVRNQDGRGV